MPGMTHDRLRDERGRHIREHVARQVNAARILEVPPADVFRAVMASTADGFESELLRGIENARAAATHAASSGDVRRAIVYQNDAELLGRALVRVRRWAARTDR